MLLRIICNYLVFFILCDSPVLLSPHMVTYGLMSSLDQDHGQPADWQ